MPPPDVARTLVRLVRVGIVAFILLSVVGGFLGRFTEESSQDVTVVVTRLQTVADDILFDADQQGSVIVGSDGVTIDCGGFAVIGTGEGTGILVTERSGVRVINCQVRNFEAGIHMVGGSGNMIDATSVSGSIVGIVLARTSNNTISNSNFSANGTGLLITSGSSGNTITGTEASGNGADGFVSLEDAGPDNLFLTNSAARNRGFGFVDASAHSPEGRYEGNLCDANTHISNPQGLCSLAG